MSDQLLRLAWKHYDLVREERAAVEVALGAIRWLHKKDRREATPAQEKIYEQAIKAADEEVASAKARLERLIGHEVTS